MNVNQLTFGGRITKELELKDSKNGKKYGRFTLVYNDFFTKKSTFLEVVCFGVTAERVARNGKKGTEALVIGKLNIEKYQTQDGQNRTSTNLIADAIEFPTLPTYHNDQANEEYLRRKGYNPSSVYIKKNEPEGRLTDAEMVESAVSQKKTFDEEQKETFNTDMFLPKTDIGKDQIENVPF